MLNLNGNQNIKHIPVEQWVHEKNRKVKEWEVKKINIENCDLETLQLNKIINVFPRLSKISASKNHIQKISNGRVDFSSREVKLNQDNQEQHQNDKCGESFIDKRNTIELDLSRNNITHFPVELFNLKTGEEYLSSYNSTTLLKIPLKLILIKNMLYHKPKNSVDVPKTHEEENREKLNKDNDQTMDRKNKNSPNIQNKRITTNDIKKNQKWRSNIIFTLSQLQISDNPNLSDLQFLNQLSTDSLSEISSLTITNCGMQQFGLNSMILSAISPSLVRLNLSFNKSLDLNQLFQEIEHFQHLRDLNLSYVSSKENPIFFPQESLCRIGDRLRSLNLSHNYFRPLQNISSSFTSQEEQCCFAFIVPSLIYTKLTEVQVLQLSHCHLGGFEDISNIDIDQNNIFPNLLTLNLDNNHLEQVPSILNYCSSLQKVSLSNNKISPLSVSNYHKKEQQKQKYKIQQEQQNQNQEQKQEQDPMIRQLITRNSDVLHLSKSNQHSTQPNNNNELLFNPWTLQTLNLSDNPRMMEDHKLPICLTPPSASPSLSPTNGLCPYIGKTLSILDLSNTGLHGKFPSVLVLQNIPQLILLNLSNNQLSSFLEEKDFTYISNDEKNTMQVSRLKTLHLEHNYISRLTSGLLKIAPKLKLIGLRGNPIRQLPSDLASVKDNPSASCRIQHLKQDTPDQILEHLYLGPSESGLSAKLLKYLRITHVISLGVQFQTPRHPKDFKYLVIPIADRPDVDISAYFSECIQFIEEAKSWNTKCLVHCQMGRSRSVTIAMAYLISKMNMSKIEAYDWIRSIRPEICPNSGFLRQLSDLEKNINDHQDIYS